LTTWLGLQDPHAIRSGDALPGILMLAGIAALVLLWLLAVHVVRRSAPPARRVWWIAAAWAAPFAIGPPLMDTTVYSYAAFGLLQRQGHSPYNHAPADLGARRVVAAIMPGQRGTPSSVGPLGTFLQHLAASIGGGSALGAVIVLRVVAVLATVALGVLAADLAGAQRSRALTLTVLNPLVLLYVVSAAHLDAVMIALVLAALSSAQQRRWLRAVVLACVAGSVSGQAFLVVPGIIVVHWLGRRTVASWRLIGRDLLVAAATFGVLGFAAKDGFGWLRTVSKQFSTHTPFSPTGAIAKLLTPIVPGASYDDLAAGARITTLTALVCAICYLLATARQRALERTAGYSLLALALLAPVLYPWYLLWGCLCLAPMITGTRRTAVLAFCAAGCFLAPPGFAPITSNAITGAALTVVAGVTVLALLRSRSTARTPRTVSAAG
jgi:hypothetical protein